MKMKTNIVILLLGIVLISCNQSKEYHLKNDQKKSQHFEHKPAVELTQKNLKNKEKNQKATYKDQQKREEQKLKNKKQKQKKSSDFQFY